MISDTQTTLATTSPTSSPPVSFSVSALAAALRPKQWIKNGFVLAALIFAGKLTDPMSVFQSAWAVLVFCALSSSCYLLNDIVDVKADRLHPLKRSRPIASGRVSIRVALGSSVLLAVTGLVASLGLGWTFALIATSYLALTVSYSMALKRIVIIDILAVATGFVLRAAAGAAAIDVPMTIWLGLLTLILASFIILGRRRADAVLGKRDAGCAITTGPTYAVAILDAALIATAIAGVIGYSSYTLLASTLAHHRAMLMTIPFVVFGLGRYLYLIRARGEGGAPEEAVLRDVPLMIGIAGWVSASICALYL